VDEFLCVYNPPNAEPLVMERMPNQYEAAPDGSVAWVHTKALYQLSQESQVVLRGCTADMCSTDHQPRFVLEVSRDPPTPPSAAAPRTSPTPSSQGVDSTPLSGPAVSSASSSAGGTTSMGAGEGLGQVQQPSSDSNMRGPAPAQAEPGVRVSLMTQDTGNHQAGQGQRLPQGAASA
ncbi:hypothetical protein QJQ45_025202, partial [Haematococcus lacustris]